MGISRFTYYAILLVALLTPAIVKSEAAHKVLILHSYYQTYHWTSDIMDGMISVLKPSDNKFSIHSEFLDAQRVSKENSWPAFENYLRTKYRNVNFDVILASDDDVLDFLIPRYKDMFPDIPFVFCGINNLDENKFKRHKQFIGISQEIDAKGTIELALKLLPRTEKFLVISDRTSAGIKTTAKFKKDLQEMGPSKQKFCLIDDFTLPELKEHLLSLGANDLVLVIRIQKIKGIDKREPVRFLKFVTDTSPVPAFRVWGKGDSGFVGGVLVSAVAQGKAAAQIGLKILRGEHVEDIPQVNRSPNLAVLNYKILKKFNIKEKNVPHGTIITNRPVTLLDKYRRHIKFIVIIFILLILTIISLATIIFYRRKNEKIILKSQEKILKSEKKYQDLYDNSPDMYVSVDAKNARIIECNQTLSDRLGYTKAEIIGCPIFDMYHDDSLENAKTQFDKFVTTGAVRNAELQLKRKDGSKLDVILNVSALCDKEGNIISSRSAWRDISDLKQLENEKRDLIQQLHQTQKMESIGVLAGGIAHDFNNILASILGFADLALKDIKNLQPENKEKILLIEDSLQEIKTAGNRVKELVKQILTFARQSDEALMPVRIDQIIKEVIKFIRSSIPSTIEIKGDLISKSLIMGNQTQIHQIMMNLFTNAAHAMDKNGGNLTVNLEDIQIDKNYGNHNLDLKHGDYIKLTVSDTGTGINPDIIDSIFDPYFTTKGVGEGTGMGLALVHGIVESYGGKIDVKSRQGKGSTFTIYLPVVHKPQVKTHDESGVWPTGTEKVLFVDDEVSIAKMGRRILETLGYEVTTQTSSVEALELFRSKPEFFDLVITDMTMPGMTGDVFVGELMSVRDDIPVILCTGYSNKISDANAAEIGIKAFSYKPMSIDKMAITIRKVLDEA